MQLNRTAGLWLNIIAGGGAEQSNMGVEVNRTAGMEFNITARMEFEQNSRGWI